MDGPKVWESNQPPRPGSFKAMSQARSVERRVKLHRGYLPANISTGCAWGGSRKHQSPREGRSRCEVACEPKVQSRRSCECYSSYQISHDNDNISHPEIGVLHGQL